MLPDERDDHTLDLADPRAAAIRALQNGTTLAEVTTALLDATADERPAAPPMDPEIERLIREAREDEPRPLFMRAIEIAVDDALGEVARQQGGIAIPIGREARGTGVWAGRSMLRRNLQLVMGPMADALEQLQGEVTAARADLAAAAGELRVPLDDMPAGSTLRRVVIANSLMRRERDHERSLMRETREYWRAEFERSRNEQAPMESRGPVPEADQQLAIVCGERDRLHAGLQALAAQVDQTNPQCPIGTALTRAGLTRSVGPEPTYAQLRERVLELPGSAAVRAAVLTVLEDQSATVLRDGGYLRPGTQARRDALTFCADVIASRLDAASPTKPLTEDRIQAAVLSALAETDCDLLDEIPEEVIQGIAARVAGYLISARPGPRIR